LPILPFKRRKIFRDEAIIEATKRYIREAAANNDIEIDRTLIDHVHVFASFPPRMSASQVVNILKGYSSRHLRMEFPWLKQLCQKDPLWARSFYWGTCGNVSAQTVKRYIERVPGLINSAALQRRGNHSVSPT
ncbi:IS200/IS605 family transposase, partial [Synechococcus sp. PCC 6716]|nr:IS200/IS605 family transposase [Synechococcus sp. PCC 6716]